MSEKTLRFDGGGGDEDTVRCVLEVRFEFESDVDIDGVRNAFEGEGVEVVNVSSEHRFPGYTDGIPVFPDGVSTGEVERVIVTTDERAIDFERLEEVVSRVGDGVAPVSGWQVGAVAVAADASGVRIGRPGVGLLFDLRPEAGTVVDAWRNAVTIDVDDVQVVVSSDSDVREPQEYARVLTGRSVFSGDEVEGFVEVARNVGDVSVYDISVTADAMPFR